MERKEWIGIIIKVLIYGLTLVGAALGVQALTSCNFEHSRSYDVSGRACIVTVDTTIVNHNGFLTIKKK